MQPLGAVPEQHVPGLHVAVDHAAGVRVRERLAHLGDQQQGGAAVEGPVALQPVLQVAVGEELGDEEDGVVVLAVLVDAHDVRDRILASTDASRAKRAW